MVVMLSRTLLVLTIFFLPSRLSAQEMTNCVQTGRAVKPSTGIEGTYLHNKCDQAVFMFWCHEGAGDSACGNKNYYKRGRKMEPDERYFNKYSLPGKAAVHLGACSGKKRHVIFGVNGIGTYACTNNDTPIIQPNDPVYIHCQDKRKLRYKWLLKYTKGAATIVRLETEGQISWLEVETRDFNNFIANNVPPAIFSNYVCNEKPTKESALTGLKNAVMDELSDELNAKRIECLEALSPTKECSEFLKPESIGSLGVRG